MTPLGMSVNTSVDLAHTDSISWLFVAGSEPARFAKAAASGAHQAILDLEDAVAVEHKAMARRSVTAWLLDGHQAWVRINSVGSPWAEDDCRDLSQIAARSGLRGIVVPKAEMLSVSEATARTPDSVPILALVETARGIRDAFAIAAHERVCMLAFGSIDYAFDLGVTSESSLDSARHAVVVASRAADLAAPLDGVTLNVRDEAVIAADARRSRELGFGGKLCIHPAQIAPAHKAFAPTSEEVTWATRVLAETERLGCDVAAFALDGQMVDTPVIKAAYRLLERARNGRTN